METISTDFEWQELIAAANDQFSKASGEQELEALRIKYLGEKSKIQEAFRTIGQVAPEQRPNYARIIQASRQKLTEIFDTAQKRLEEIALEKELSAQNPDLTLPGLPLNILGSKHPITQVSERIIAIFERMGFTGYDSPEVETEYHNFTALNLPEDHPARDEQDTFYTQIDKHVVMRSQTSPFQVRILEKGELPIRAYSLGRVYRNEETNARKLPFFHQFEVLYVDHNVDFPQLKWTLQSFFNQFFDQEIPIRFRPDFFPFTEPSAEVDAQCIFCSGKGCLTCGGKGWLELLGCGMVDPNVLKISGVDPEIYTGFAAGLGIERLAMLKYGIPDIRQLYLGDLRVLRQI